MKRLGFVCLAAVLLTGCATWATYTPVQKAAVVAYSATATYKEVYAEVRDFTPRTEKERTIYNEEVVPAVNRLKRLIADYCDGVEVWRRTAEKPVNLDALAASIDDLLADVVTTIQTWKGGPE